MLKAVWTDINGITDEMIQSLLPHISEERRLFAMRGKNVAVRGERIMAEVLARYALSCVSGARPETFSFKRTELGKPYQTTVPELFFNISHSGGVVACVVSDSETGIDVECADRVKPKMAGTILCEEEMRLASDELFCTSIWCRKESYLKMLGTGIRVRPSDINTFELERAGECGWLEGVIEQQKKDTFPTFCYAIFGY